MKFPKVPRFVQVIDGDDERIQRRNSVLRFVLFNFLVFGSLIYATAVLWMTYFAGFYHWYLRFAPLVVSLLALRGFIHAFVVRSGALFYLFLFLILFCGAFALSAMVYGPIPVIAAL